MVERRTFLAGVGIGILAVAKASFAQSLGKKVHRIGWPATGDPTSYRFSLAAFCGRRRSLNYIEGQNIIIEYPWAEGRVQPLPELVEEPAALKGEVIVDRGTN